MNMVVDGDFSGMLITAELKLPIYNFCVLSSFF